MELFSAKKKRLISIINRAIMNNRYFSFQNEIQYLARYISSD